jgi:hypothetical protein
VNILAYKFVYTWLFTALGDYDDNLSSCKKWIVKNGVNFTHFKFECKYNLYRLEDLSIDDFLSKMSDGKITSFPENVDSKILLFKDCLETIQNTLKATTNSEHILEIFLEMCSAYYLAKFEGDNTNASRALAYIKEGTLSPVVSNWELTEDPNGVRNFTHIQELHEAYKEMKTAKMIYSYK